jgi:hypothetical protein
MRKRRPPFALVLSVLVAGAAVAIFLAGQGGGHRANTRPPTIGLGPSHACVTTRAEAQAEDHSAIVITATAQAPVLVTEHAVGPKGIATVTRSGVATARVRAEQPVGVKRTAVAQARACANSASSGGARTAALRRAYAVALAAAHAQAIKDAAGELATAMHEQYPSVLAQARTKAEARAHQLARAAEAPFAREAQAEARRRAGG